MLIVAIAAAIAVVVAYQVSTRYRLLRANAVAGQTNIPTLAPGQDPLAGVTVVPKRIRGSDYQRSEFGDAWSDDTDAPSGRNGCDTRILEVLASCAENLVRRSNMLESLETLRTQF